MQLTCSNCGATILAENINIQKTLALCSHCNQVFDFGDMAETQKSKRRKTKQPERLQVDEQGGRLQLSYRRIFDHRMKVTLIIFSIMALMFSVMPFGARADGAPPPVVFFLGMMAVALWYVVAALFTKTTRVIADDKILAIKTGPLPLPITEAKSLDMEDIARVYCEETIKSKAVGRFDRYYHVRAELVDGNEIILLRSLPKRVAFYIAQTIQAQLQTGELAPMIDPGDEFYDDDGEFDDLSLAHLMAEDNASSQVLS
jgi:hypothetical protein